MTLQAPQWFRRILWLCPATPDAPTPAYNTHWQLVWMVCKICDSWTKRLLILDMMLLRIAGNDSSHKDFSIINSCIRNAHSIQHGSLRTNEHEHVIRWIPRARSAHNDSTSKSSSSRSVYKIDPHQDQSPGPCIALSALVGWAIAVFQYRCSLVSLKSFNDTKCWRACRVISISTCSTAFVCVCRIGPGNAPKHAPHRFEWNWKVKTQCITITSDMLMQAHHETEHDSWNFEMTNRTTTQTTQTTTTTLKIQHGKLETTLHTYIGECNPQNTRDRMNQNTMPQTHVPQ